jgi:hypothetical protein
MLCGRPVFVPDSEIHNIKMELSRV